MRDRNVALCDLAARFESFPRKVRSSYFEDDGIHPLPSGDAVIAQELYRCLREHDLLVRVEQREGMFGFSFNICEPIDDERYAGNRYPGVRYHGEAE